jgi:Ca-activated chloride channel family protein
MFSFQYIQYLFILLAIPFFIALYFYVLNWKKKTIKKIGDERLVKELIKDYSPQKFALKFVLTIAVFALCVVALANLRSSNGTQKINRNGIDVMVALDVSKSMLAQDVQPNRLERAKQVLNKLIDKLSNDRIGIVVFAGKAYLQMPLTADHSAAKMYLSTASTDAVPTQGTVIGDALKMCYAAFNTKEKKYKSVVLISDGEDHDEEAVKVATQMSTEGVMINTIGIGSGEGSTIIDAVTNEVKKDNQGNTVISKLNESALKEIAQKGNGSYQLFTNTDAVVRGLEQQLSSMDKRTVTEDSLVNYKTYFQWFLGLAFILLVIELFISEKKSSTQKKYNKKNKSFNPSIANCLLPIATFLLPIASLGQTETELNKKATEAYKKEEYEKAANLYKQAAEKMPKNSTTQYNLGNAMYKKTKVDEAVAAYDKAIANTTDATLKSKSFYNKGVVLQNSKNLQGCVDAYKNALKLNPNDDDARQNLQKALQQLKEKQEKENKKKNKPKEDENKKEKEKPKNEDEKNDQPKPQPSKISKQDAEEKLKALQQQEKNLQDKLKKVNAASPNKPEKDW